MLRQHPPSLEEVPAEFEERAAACGTDAWPLLASLGAVIEGAARKARAQPSVRGVFLEWLDPPYRAGHWTPDLLELAGIEDPLGRPGIPSIPGSWAEVAAARPELLVLAPCGFDQDRAEKEAALVRSAIESVGAEKGGILDGAAYFNRPGRPRVDSPEVLGATRVTEVGGPRETCPLLSICGPLPCHC